MCFDRSPHGVGRSICTAQLYKMEILYNRGRLKGLFCGFLRGFGSVQENTPDTLDKSPFVSFFTFRFFAFSIANASGSFTDSKGITIPIETAVLMNGTNDYLPQRFLQSEGVDIPIEIAVLMNGTNSCPLQRF